MIQVDDRVYWGIVNYTKHGEDTSQTYEERPYLIFEQNDPFIEKCYGKLMILLEIVNILRLLMNEK